MILFGADNHPPILDKDLYDSWKSRMELYMQNKENERMILESVEHGPLIWPMIEENGVIRTKKYDELSATEKIQADYDMKETNIILQGLPSDIYSLVNHHRVAKDLWERIQLLMQVNTKFLNNLPPKWSKFVTDVKLVKDLHTTNFDQLHAYLQQHKLHANEVRIMRERNQDPLALVANHQMTPSNVNTYQSSYNNPQFQQHFSPSYPQPSQCSPSQSPQYGPIHPTQHYSTTYSSIPRAITYPTTPYPNAYSSIVHQENYPQPQFVPQIEYIVFTVNQQTHLAEFPQVDVGLAFPVFKQGDDPIDAINKMMSFLSTIVTLCFLSTNNQLRNSSNPRQQATIHDGKVTVQPLQGRPNSYVVTWQDSVQSQRGKGMPHGLGIKFSWLKHKEMISTTKSVLMANLSSYGSNVLSKVPHSDNTNNDTLNQSVQEMTYSEQTHLVNYPENKITSDSNIIPYSQYLLETQNAAVHDTYSSAQQDDMILFKAQQIRPMLYDGNVIAKETNVISIADSEETLMLEEET
ncbi:hypothetical protein Tco_1062162 [Tanacetum coccineum]